MRPRHLLQGRVHPPVQLDLVVQRAQHVGNGALFVARGGASKESRVIRAFALCEGVSSAIVEPGQVQKHRLHCPEKQDSAYFRITGYPALTESASYYDGDMVVYPELSVCT